MILEINKDTVLKEIVRDYPSTIDLFNDLEIDYCCHGTDTVEQATGKKDLNIDETIEKIEEAISNDSTNRDNTSQSIIDFEDLDRTSMVKSIERGHHDDERDLLKLIDEDLNKILLVHYQDHSDQLVKVHEIFGKIKTELEAHLAKEEKLVFPMFEKETTSQTISYIDELEDEHETMGGLIENLQEATDSFVPPQGACITYERTFENLKKLTEDIFVHIFKENSVLFEQIRQDI